MNTGYDEAPLTWELREHLDQVQILVRVRNDRVMYRNPVPEPRQPEGPAAMTWTGSSAMIRAPGADRTR